MQRATVFSVRDAVDYADGSVVSKQIVKKKSGTITLFAFDRGQSLSEHTAPFDALAQVAEGEIRFTIGGEPHVVRQDQSILLPANVPHALAALTRAKMLLTMIRGE